VKEGWVLAVPYDVKHGVGTPYLKPTEGSSSSKGNRTIKRYALFMAWKRVRKLKRQQIIKKN